MSIRPIVLSDDPLIRRKSRKVGRNPSALQQLVDDMLQTMEDAKGIGLAAIQIGVPQRVVVVQLPEDEEIPGSGELYVIVNPQLARVSRETEDGIEGCLSVPGFVGEVSRHTAMTVKGMDLERRALRIEAEGFLARVFQHEIDHCSGILYVDHITDPEKIWPVTEGEEEAAERAQASSGDLDRSGPLV